MKKFWQKIKNIVLKIKQKIDKVKVKYKIAAAVILVLAAVFGCIAHLYYKTSELYHISGVFYHKIGGHNTEMSVLDDQELIIRTFLHGEMTKVDKVLYIQYEGDGERGVSKDNTQSLRFGEIQRTTMLLKERFDKEIHNRILELGKEDDAWDEDAGQSILWKKHEAGKNMMNNFYIPEQ